MDHEIPMRDRQFLRDPNHFLANTIDDLDLDLKSDDPLKITFWMQNMKR